MTETVRKLIALIVFPAFNFDLRTYLIPLKYSFLSCSFISLLSVYHILGSQYTYILHLPPVI